MGETATAEVGEIMPPKEQNPWELAQEHLKKVLDEHSYKSWFSQTRFDSCDNGKLVVAVPSQFFASWLRDHYLEAISLCVREFIPDLNDIQFKPTLEAAGSDPEPHAVAAPGKRRMRPLPQYPGFNPRYTFDRFVIGAGNRFAHAASKAVATSPGRAYNPLFLYGGTGLGKTHLMHAIGHEILQADPEANVVVISSEDFTNQLIESIAKKSTQRFRNKYRKVDILLIDDIHFIAGKEATQEEFFHTFNALFDMHKQIVLSSDRGPKEIQGLEERLVSRFEWGLVTDVQVPDLETRMAILKNKAGEENVSLPADVIRYIATCVTTNIRELEGALITVLAFSKLQERPINLATVEEVLRDLIGSEKIKPVTAEDVLRAVAEHFDLRIADLRGRSRQRQISFPRQLGMYLCKELVPSLSLSEIGEIFGGKDHTTVLYACQKITKESRSHSVTRQTLSYLEKAIRA
jgi:chromosomal replication initiator protein